jgi:hypothetical protein
LESLQTNGGLFRIEQGRAFATLGNLNNSGRIVVGSGSQTVLRVNGHLSNTGTVDVAGNLIIDYSGPVGTLMNDIRAQLAAGSINSTNATSSTGVGYADNSMLSPVKTTFAGQPVDPTTLLIKFTYFGDTDLDGDVDVADLGNLASAWQSVGLWSSGDFDYSGFVDVADLGLLATNWQAGVGSPLGPSLSQALWSRGLGNVPVPEPASIGVVLGLAACSLLRPCTQKPSH